MSSKRYAVTPNADGTFTIPAVEIFRLGEHKGFNYDAAWFARAQVNNQNLADRGWNPPVFIGHTGFSGSEKAKVADAVNLRLAADNATVIADYLLETDGHLKLFQSGGYPHRSVEVYGDQALFGGVAQLGATEPYHKFPPLHLEKFSAALKDQQPAQIIFENAGDITINEKIEEQHIQRELSDLDWALWDALYAVRDDEQMSLDEKQAKMGALIDEWAGLKKTAEAELLTLTDDGTEPAAMAALAAGRAKLAAERAAFEAEKLTRFLADISRTGIARPVLDNFRALRVALSAGQSGKVKFSGYATSGSSAAEKIHELDFLSALDRFLTDLTARHAAGTLFAALAETRKPFNPEPPTILNNEGGEPVLNPDVTNQVNDYMAKHNIPFEQFQATYLQLKRTKQIQLD